MLDLKWLPNPKKTTTLNTLKKWEEEFKCKFSYDTKDNKIYRLRCVDCSSWVDRIKNLKNFTKCWINPGSESVSKDSVKKHVSTEQHTIAHKLKTACKPNTYGERRGYPKGCKKCPENTVTDPSIIATHVSECKCSIGFRGDIRFYEDRCRRMSCVPFPDINNAVMINQTSCGNPTHNTKCHYQCKEGYKLKANSKGFVQCKDNAAEYGVWSTDRPECERIQCNADWVAASDRNRFQVQCTSDIDNTINAYSSSTTCEFTCKDIYYQKAGNKKITCLKTGKWDGDSIKCEVSKCPKISRSSKYIKSRSPYYNCFEKELTVKDTCRFHCDRGFKLTSGKHALECQQSAGNDPIGNWNDDLNVNPPTCEDKQNPEFDQQDKCNDEIQIKKNTLPGKKYAIVNFELINVTDNSGEIPEVTCLDENKPCPYEMGKDYEFKYSSAVKIKFKATDRAGNFQYCIFQVTITDNEDPKNIFCPENQKIETQKDHEIAKWEEPRYTDNCGNYSECKIDIVPSVQSGNKFYANVSKVAVKYTAKDESRNMNEECIFTVEVIQKSSRCPAISPPINGLVVYFAAGVANMKCQRNHYPNGKIAYLYLCNKSSKVWYDPASYGGFPLPDCIRKTPADATQMKLLMMLQFDGDCNTPAVKQQILVGFSGISGEKVDSLQYHCGATSIVNRRKRSTLKQIIIKYAVVEKGDIAKIEKNPAVELEKLKKHLENTVAPKTIVELKKPRDWSVLNRYVTKQLSVSTQRKPATEKCYNDGDVQMNSAFITQRCTSCGPGTFKNISSNACEKCPTGTYQPEARKTSCLSCPEGTLIVSGDTKNFTSCKTLCKPGEYSPNGLSPCNICSQGQYSDKYRSKTCTSCPRGTTTVVTGTISKDDCGSVCSPGSYSSNGVEPCRPAPKGYYQTNAGKTHAAPCPDLESTGSQGSASLSSCQVMNDCYSNPCMNGANCVDLKDNYLCQCTAGYWGKNCELEVDECALGPCANNATCLDKFNSYKCECLPGTGGRHCDQVIKRCNNALCGTNGHCVDLPNHEYKCVCNDGHTGDFCETTIDNCHPNPCKNNGVCQKVDTADKFSCQCPSVYGDKICNTKIDNCASNPCKNGATCVDKHSTFACHCAKGYEGLQCQTQTDMCQHKKCHNGGECELLIGDVKCKCAPGYYGEQCDYSSTSDFDFSFQSRISTSFASIHGRKDLYQFTLAFWMRTTDKVNVGTAISYAVELRNGKVDDNALFLTDYSGFNLGINNKTESIEVDANDGEWHHIAVTWTSTTGYWKAYKDGVFVSDAPTPFQQGQFVPKGGLFVIGEEQDSMEGDFTPQESFYGDMSQLNIWDRELSSSEIYDLSTTCGFEGGNVVVWSDFAEQTTGSIIKTSPSLVCDFQSDLRQFQHLEDRDLPSNLKTVGNAKSIPNTSPLKCGQECIAQQQWCRSFTYIPATRKCDLYAGSILTASSGAYIEPKESGNVDLYSLSCVTALGMVDGRIKDSQISASSSAASSSPGMARLYKTAKPGEVTAHWQPRDSDAVPYIQIDLGRVYRITAISTHGHFNPSKTEFATSYNVHYRSSGKWILFSRELPGNKDSQTVVRNELYFKTDMIRIYPKRNAALSSGVALRLELFGCPDRPQGSPVVKPDSNQCSNNPCQNSGKCIDLYRRYQCVCPRGYEGQNCQTQTPCSSNGVDVGLNQVMFLQISLTKPIGSYWTASFSCKNGFKPYGSRSATCNKGVWNVSGSLNCTDTNECSSNLCSDGCDNLHGSYRCWCPRGKILSSNSRTCIDVDECSSGTDGCEGACSNAVFDYTCQCPAGYHIRGKRMCYDFDECSAGTHNCQHMCENTKGSFKCACEPGYKLSSDGRSCIYIHCPALPRIGNVKQIVVNEKSAEYICNSGYKINGLQIRNCQADGTWAGNAPKCEAVRCVHLYSPENGKIVSQNGQGYDAKYRFECNKGYKMIGSAARSCLQNATWSGSQPYCIRNVCPTFKVINGRILGLATNVNSVVRVQCNAGYRLVRSEFERRTCQSNGHWTGGGGNNAVVECKIIRCGRVPTTGNVQVKYTGGDVYQATVSYSCLSGLCLEGERLRRCQANEQWSGNPPKCMSNSCCKPPVPKYATLYSDNRYAPGDSAYIQCDKGYESSGQTFRECQKDLQWNGDDTKCTIVDCGDPGDLVNGNHYGKGVTTYASKVRYFCKPGFLLSGSRARVCQADGKWSGTKPNCFKGKNGGHILAKSGTLQCNEGEVCHWLIQVTQRKKVHVNFVTYNINEDNEKAELYDGEEAWLPYVTFTKTLRPRAVVSNGHFVRIITDGFVRIDFKESDCGGMFSEKYGNIISPNYPKTYPNNLDCVWTIHRPYNRIELRFIKFLLQRRNVDYVTITEGPFENTDEILYRRYGYGIPGMNKDWADRWYWVHFKTDHLYGEPGFQAVWRLYEPRK